jgi:SAM-dependent methyltransferase
VELIEENSQYLLKDSRKKRWAVPYTYEAVNSRADILLSENKKHIEGKTVLDIGCHFGTFSYLCSKLNATNVVGIDSDKNLIEEAVILKEYYNVSNLNFYQADVLEYLNNLEENSFDTVICFGLLYYIPDNYAFLKLIKKVAKEAIILDTFTAYYNAIQGKDGPKYYSTFNDDFFNMPILLHSITKAKKQNHYKLDKNTFRYQEKQNPLTLLTCPTKSLLEVYFNALSLQYKQLKWSKYVTNIDLSWRLLESSFFKKSSHWSDIYSSQIRVSYLLTK